MMSSCGINTTQTNLTGPNTLDKFFENLSKAASQQHSAAIDIQNFATQKTPDWSPNQELNQAIKDDRLKIRTNR